MKVFTRIAQKKQYVIILVLLISVIFILGGLIYYKYEKENHIKEKLNYLESVSKLKVAQIGYWLNSHYSGAYTLVKSEAFIRRIKVWYRNLEDLRIKDEIKRRLEIVKSYNGYESIILASKSGDVLVSTDPDTISIDPVIKQKIKSANGTELVLSDFYYCPFHNTVHYDLAAPVIDSSGKSIAIVLFRINPNEAFFPLIQSLPTLSETAENVLVRKDGDSILYLSELRFKKQSAFKLKMPLTDDNLPAVNAIKGFRGFFEGTDYRGEKVFSFIAAVPNTDWYMITKLDQDELYSGLFVRSVIIAVFVLFLIALTSFGFFWFYNTQQKKIFFELYRNEQELSKIKKEFETTLYSIGDAVIATNPTGRIKMMNKVAETLTGWTEKEAKSRKIEEVFNIVNEETRQKVENPVKLVLEKEIVVGLANHTVLISRNGKEYPIKDSGAPIKNENNKVIGVVLVFRDQTEEAELQKKLKSAADRNQAILEAVPDIIMEIDINKVYTWANNAGMQFFGDDVLGQKADYYFVRKQNTIELISPLFNGESESIQYIESWQRRFDGEERLLAWYCRALKDKKGKVIGAISAAQDITEKNKVEQELKESEAFTRLVMNNLPVGIAVNSVTPTIKARYINDSLIKIYRTTREELQKEDNFWEAVYHDEELREKIKEQFLSDIASGDVKRMHWSDIPIARKGEETTYISARNIPLPDSNLMISTVWDVTERVKAENMLIEQNKDLERQYEEHSMLNEALRQTNYDLEIAKSKAEENDKLKTAFLQNMSHEIRTPLNGILGFSQLLTEPGLSKDEVANFTSFITKSGNRLLEIVNNILDIARIEAGQITVNNMSFPIFSTIKDLHALYLPIAQEKELKLSYTVPNNFESIYIFSDQSKIVQILSNLINNAIKFTKKGEIEFGFEIKAERIQFFVKDSGIGIEKGLQEMIFERFSQADVSVTRGYEGAGLGLAICKGLVEIIGGKIWLESELSKGSIFYFSLPFALHQSKKVYILEEQTASQVNQNLIILIAEDDFLNYKYLKSILEKERHAVLYAENGQIAVDMVKNNPEIDIVLMDIKMPVLDGIEAANRIKAFKPELPIIAQTAYAFDSEKEKILQTGAFNSYVTKPINYKELLEIIVLQAK